jgi:uncharacterized protein (DUF1778 family)
MSETLTLTTATGVLRELEMAAKAEGLSVEAFVLRAARQRARDLVDAEEFFAERARRAGSAALATFDRLFDPNRTGGEPPQPGDEMPE